MNKEFLNMIKLFSYGATGIEKDIPYGNNSFAISLTPVLALLLLRTAALFLL